MCSHILKSILNIIFYKVVGLWNSWEENREKKTGKTELAPGNQHPELCLVNNRSPGEQPWTCDLAVENLELCHPRLQTLPVYNADSVSQNQSTFDWQGSPKLTELFCAAFVQQALLFQQDRLTCQVVTSWRTQWHPIEEKWWDAIPRIIQPSSHQEQKQNYLFRNHSTMA